MAAVLAGTDLWGDHRSFSPALRFWRSATRGSLCGEFQECCEADREVLSQRSSGDLSTRRNKFEIRNFRQKDGQAKFEIRELLSCSFEDCGREGVGACR